MVNIKPPPPKHVADAKLKGDTEALKFYGSIGGKKSAEARKKRKAEAERNAQQIKEQILLEFPERAEETNEDTHPVD